MLATKNETLRLDALESVAEHSWLILNTINVFTMQAGFALLETGSVRGVHAKSILVKNILDGSIACAMWYLIGFGIYDGRYWLNVHDYIKMSDVRENSHFLTSYAFASTTSTIISGAIAGRMSLRAYTIIIVVVIGMAYPISAYLVWNQHGILSLMGFVDIAGGATVHMLGGVVGFVAAALVGPRVSRFVRDPTVNKVVVHDVQGNSASMAVLGAFLLTVSWFSFNAMSARAEHGESIIDGAARACVITLLGTSCAALSGSIMSKWRFGTFKLNYVINSSLAGLVAITSGCTHLDVGYALLIVFCTVLLSDRTAYILCHKLHIDDPLDVTAVHAVPGFIGSLALGLFDRYDGMLATGDPNLLKIQVLGNLCILGVAIGVTAPIILLMKLFLPGFRVSDDDQLVGLDKKYHDGYETNEIGAVEVAIHQARKSAEARLLRRISSRGSETRKRSLRAVIPMPHPRGSSTGTDNPK